MNKLDFKAFCLKTHNHHYAKTICKNFQKKYLFIKFCDLLKLIVNGVSQKYWRHNSIQIQNLTNRKSIFYLKLITTFGDLDLVYF